MADIKEIKSISIIDYAQSRGYTVKRIGKYYTLTEHDSIRINPSANSFNRNSNGAYGSIIDFVMDIEGKDLKTALFELGEIIDSKSLGFKPHEKIEKKVTKPKELILPKASEHSKNVFAYLTMTRKLDSGIVNEFIQNDNLYQDKMNNCVFVSYDDNGKAVFANKRGTNSYRKFVSDIEGSDYNHCFFINNGAPNLIVTESVIDSMSIMTATKKNGKNYKNCSYLALSGSTKIAAVRTHVKEHSEIKTVIICLDNDESGRLNAEKIHEALKDENIRVIDKFPTESKDWNEELILTIEKQTPQTEKKTIQNLSNEVNI